MRRKIVAGNWKMNKTASETTKLIGELKEVTKNDDVDVIICPTAVCIPAALKAAEGSNIKIGAQNMYYEENGAFTGEIAPNMLTDLGVEYVILGHSERRQYFGETDIIVNKKVLKAIEHKLTPMICVGETLDQREQGITIDLIRTQVKVALNGVKAEDAAKLVIAYEPVWAIGTGKTASSEQAEEVCASIRESIKELYNDDVAQKLRIQYGGSVNPGNAKELFNMGNIDGGLVGGASLTVDFGGIINY